MTFTFPSLRTPRADQTLVVDTQIAGEIIRVVVQSPLRLRADSAAMALAELTAEHDDFRRFVIDPPRGHVDVNASLLLPPFSQAATRSLLVASKFGFVPLAGTPLLASAVVAVELQMLPITGPSVRVVLETALGLQTLEVEVGAELTRTARWLTTAPTVRLMDHMLDIGEPVSVPVALIDAGLPYIVVRRASLNVAFTDVAGLGAAGRDISRVASQTLPMERFGVDGRTTNYPVLVVDDAKPTGPASANLPTAWIYPDGQVARMPAGTGALAAAAYVNAAENCPPDTLVSAVSPFGEVIRSRLDDGFGQAMVEADIEIVSLGVLL